MESNTAVAPTPTCALPSSTFSTSCINSILGMFLESANSIEEIANENNLSIPTVMQCLEEQKPFLKNMLNTLELRVRLIASRAEVVAIECLREIASLGRDSEARRKAASKLLSHFGKALSQRTPRASVGPHSPTHSRVASEGERASRPSPRPAGRSPLSEAKGDEGCSDRAIDHRPL